MVRANKLNNFEEALKYPFYTVPLRLAHPGSIDEKNLKKKTG